MIEAKRLTKYFGHRVAVDDISFSIGRGEVLGFLGPNAAGKSTTMRMITGFLPPTSGTAMVGGFDITQDPIAARRKLGYLPENAPSYPDMTVLGFLGFVADIRGFSGPEKAKRVQETLERCFLSEVRYQGIQTLSKGFKQRVCFAQSILHNPEYLIMDEPTDGLDPNQKHEVRMMIREMAQQKTIILSTHILEEMEAVCTRAVIIARGKIVADDTPQRLKAQSIYHGAVCLRVNLQDGEGAIQDLKRIPAVKATEVLEKDMRGISLRVFPVDPGSSLARELLQYFGERGLAVEGFMVEEGRLDDVFRRFTTEGETEAGK